MLFWEAAYALGLAPWDTGVVPPEVERLVVDEVVRPPARVLDIGCGSGTNVVFLAQHGLEAIGVDISHLAVRRARARIARSGVDASCYSYDVTRLHWPASPIDGQFQLMLDMGCFHGLDVAQRADYSEMVRRLLAPDGHLLLYVHMSGGVSVSGSSRRPMPARRRWLLALVRRVLRPSRPPRPNPELVERTFQDDCRLIRVEEGEDAGRPSAWFLWQRKVDDGRSES